MNIFETVYGIEILDLCGQLDRQICMASYQRLIVPLATKIRQLPIRQNLLLLNFYSRLLDKTKDINPQKSKAILKTLSERISESFEAYLKTL